MTFSFTGLSAFPITPMHQAAPDEARFATLITRLVDAKVDSIGALGSTGSYAFLTRNEREKIARLAVQHAGTTPVLVSIGAINLRDTLLLAEDAQKAGVKALLLPPMSYFPLRDEEVFTLYETVNKHISIPLVVYDTPGTTQFHFSDALMQRICELPHVRSIKLPSGSPTAEEATARMQRLLPTLPKSISPGISGDPTAASALMQGARIWYSEWGGLFPHLARQLTDAALAGQKDEVARINAIFTPFWEMSVRYGGSLRVIASAAEIMGLAGADALPSPLQKISQNDMEKLASLIKTHKPS